MDQCRIHPHYDCLCPIENLAGMFGVSGMAIMTDEVMSFLHERPYYFAYFIHCATQHHHIIHSNATSLDSELTFTKEIAEFAERYHATFPL